VSKTTLDSLASAGLLFLPARIAKDARNRRIFELWLACHTQQEIAEAVGLTEEGVRLVTQETASLPKLGKSDKAAAEHATGFDPYADPLPSG